MTGWILRDNDWNVRPPAAACAVCGRRFADGENILSRLEFDAGAGHRRADLCLACAGAASDRWVSAWRTVWRSPPATAEPIQRETAESLLRRLIESRDERHLAAIFVLAVMLERKRVLVERDVELMEGGRRRRIYEHRRTGEVFTIVDPPLHLDDLERVQLEVAQLLEGGDAAVPATAASG
ncbi:MAG: hypothetical protein N2652_04640 [Kiritimatiellae bacterium]|nr:hypothetical protein [Kiritimatiellia bacterium]